MIYGIFPEVHGVYAALSLLATLFKPTWAARPRDLRKYDLQWLLCSAANAASIVAPL